MEDSLNNILASTKEAQKALLKLTNEERNLMLRNIYEAIDKNREYILKENEKDIKLAKDALIKDSMIERLTLNDKRIDDLILGIKNIMSLEDYIGEVIDEIKRDNGLKINKVRVPFGVIAVIF